MLQVPGEHTESQEYVFYLREQIQALRLSAHGLTEQQARECPTRSELSIGGILKHVTQVVFQGIPRWLEMTDPVITEEMFEQMAPQFYASFALTEEEELAHVLAAFDSSAQRYLDLLGALDPDASTLVPNRMWLGETQPHRVKNRFQLMHQVEELARHAGHADIIREQLDGKVSTDLLQEAPH